MKNYPADYTLKDAATFNKQGLDFYDQNKPGEAIECYQKALFIRVRDLPTYHQDLIDTYKNISEAALYMGDYELALKYTDMIIENHKQQYIHEVRLAGENATIRSYGKVLQGCIFLYNSTLTLAQNVSNSSANDTATFPINNINNVTNPVNYGATAATESDNEWTSPTGVGTIIAGIVGVIGIITGIAGIFYARNSRKMEIERSEEEKNSREQDSKRFEEDMKSKAREIRLLNLAINANDLDNARFKLIEEEKKEREQEKIVTERQRLEKIDRDTRNYEIELKKLKQLEDSAQAERKWHDDLQKIEIMKLEESEKNREIEKEKLRIERERLDQESKNATITISLLTRLTRHTSSTFKSFREKRSNRQSQSQLPASDGNSVFVEPDSNDGIINSTTSLNLDRPTSTPSVPEAERLLGNNITKSADIMVKSSTSR